MSKLQPQTHAIRALEADGWHVAVVERRITKFLTKDLFGGFDLLCVHPDGDVAAIQVTSRSHVSERVKKVAALPAIPALRKAGWGLFVWGWDEAKAEWRKVDVS